MRKLRLRDGNNMPKATQEIIENRIGWLQRHALSCYLALSLSVGWDGDGDRDRDGDGGLSSPLSTPGTRVVLNIFSYWAEHRGRIPISIVCGKRWLVSCIWDPCDPTSRGPQDHVSVPSPQEPYRRHLLAAQALAV
jgi:hypothetical protein